MIAVVLSRTMQRRIASLAHRREQDELAAAIAIDQQTRIPADHSWFETRS
jgi:hypothetical protein